MFLTAHAAFGALVATQTSNPTAAFVGGFLSHFVLDFIPHGDEKVGQLITSHKKKFILIAGIDITLASLITVYVASIALIRGDQVFILLAGILGAVLPDFLSMAFPELHQLFRRNIVVSTSYKILRALSVAQLVAWINALHHRIHQFIARRFNFRLEFTYGLLWQAIFLGFVLYILSQKI